MRSFMIQLLDANFFAFLRASHTVEINLGDGGYGLHHALEVFLGILFSLGIIIAIVGVILAIVKSRKPVLPLKTLPHAQIILRESISNGNIIKYLIKDMDTNERYTFMVSSMKKDLATFMEGDDVAVVFKDGSSSHRASVVESIKPLN